MVLGGKTIIPNSGGLEAQQYENNGKETYEINLTKKTLAKIHIESETT